MAWVGSGERRYIRLINVVFKVVVDDIVVGMSLESDKMT